MIQVIRETHTCPPEIQERLTRAGGLNRFGEPNFRIVWSWSRLGWIGGWWTLRDSQGEAIGHRFEMRHEPKWLPPWDRWILECWRPPEWFGSPWLWEMQTTVWSDEARRMGRSLPSLGPYPSRGDYILTETIDFMCDACLDRMHEPGLRDEEKRLIAGSCMDRKFLQVTPRVANLLAWMVKSSRERTHQQIKDEIAKVQAIEAALSDKRDEEMMALAQEVELSKETKERIERLLAPRIETQLAATKRLMDQMSPAQRAASIKKSGRTLAAPYLN